MDNQKEEYFHSSFSILKIYYCGFNDADGHGQDWEAEDVDSQAFAEVGALVLNEAWIDVVFPADDWVVRVVELALASEAPVGSGFFAVSLVG
jgi:hypothetical protein